MQRSRLLLVVAIAGAILGGAAVYVVRADQVAGPTDQALLQTFRAHRPVFEQADCRTDHRPSGELSKVGVEFTTCDYDGTLRLGFSSNKLGLAIGPGWSKGLTRVVADPRRKGTLVPSTDYASKLPADVYLRPIQDQWFIYYQRDE